MNEEKNQNMNNGAPMDAPPPPPPPPLPPPIIDTEQSSNSEQKKFSVNRTGYANVKADLTKRFLAALIDGMIAFFIGLIPVIGGLIGCAYMLCRDGLALDFMDQRSIGKKLLKLRPIRRDGQPMDVLTSIKRNFPLAIGSLGQVFYKGPSVFLIMLIPLSLLGLVAVIIEIILVTTDPEGRRIGDKIGDTMVVEVSE